MSTHREPAKVVIDGKQLIGTPCPGLFILQRRACRSPGAPSDQSAKVLLPRLAKALSKPGITREAVFGKSSGRAVFAYSMDPSNPEQLVREDAQGKRTVGRMLNGRFRPTRSST
jgi:hypothetical protein